MVLCAMFTEKTTYNRSKRTKQVVVFMGVAAVLIIGYTKWDQLFYKPSRTLSLEKTWLAPPPPASCACTRVTNITEVNMSRLSTCNAMAALRGRHQNVVSFSFFGDSDKGRNYFKGIEENAKLMSTYFPGWVMRVYHAHHLHYNFICTMECRYSHLDFCHVGKIPRVSTLLDIHGAVWRFLPMADELVDRFVSRDLDSRPTERELQAVSEWIRSNKTFHFMRDHPAHNTLILAGMWGARVTIRRQELRVAAENLIKGAVNKVKYGTDQFLLRDIIGPLAEGDSIQHDSHWCETFATPDWQPWPSRRVKGLANFVGAPVGYSELTAKCPRACRPLKHQDWLAC